MREISFSDAIREAILAEMEADSTVFVEGEDVSWGGICGKYKGIRERFPNRIFDTPISETAIAGLGLGAAVMGLRPIVEFSMLDFTLVAMDEICNQIAKFHYLNASKSKIPLVLHAYCGSTGGSAAQHSQCLEALYAHIPGLKLVIPSNPADAKGLMASAIHDDNPVMYLTYMGLLNERGEVAEEDYSTPIGKAAITVPGKDITLISYGSGIPLAVRAAEMLMKDGIYAEIIDLRTLVPLDKDTIIASVKKTGKVVIAHEAVKQGGFGAEVAAMIAEEAFHHLTAPIKRLGAPFCPVPFSPILKGEYCISVPDIYHAARELFQ